MPKALHALLVHGAGGGGWEWTFWRRGWQARGVVVQALDLQPASSGLEHTSLEEYRRQVMRALHDLPRPRVLVGASLGGLLAAQCADDADALILVNPLPPAPWAMQLPVREWPVRIPWYSQARLVATRRAIPDADDASALFAFRRWRDESGLALRQAWAGVEVKVPACPTLVMVSSADDEVPREIVEAMAAMWGGNLVRVAAPSHVSPLLGRSALIAADLAVAWLNGLALRI